MISGWITEPVEAFARTVLGKQVYVRQGTAASAIGSFTWETLASVLASEPAPDALVVGNGQLQSGPAPRSPAELQACLDAGNSIVVRRAEQHDEGLANLAHTFASELPGEVHVQLFATPAQRRSFGWHFDAEEVFIVQTHGVKAYYFRQNTVFPRPLPPADAARPDFSRFRAETSRIMSCTLQAGDLLYLPSPTWHIAQAIEPSLSISVGLRPHG